MKFKNKLANITLIMLIFSAVGCSNDKAMDDNSSVESSNSDTDKESGESEIPESISFMTSTITFTESNGIPEFEQAYKDLTGIELEVIRPDHNSYDEKLNLSFTAGDAPDVFRVEFDKYASYVGNNAVWDMTDAWDSSDLKASNSIDENYIDGLKVNDRLYGFPTQRGNGTMSYIRGDWLDNLDMEIPTNYDEYYDVLEAFTYNDPDGNGIDDTYGMTSAGLTNDMYLTEFYQGAVPDLTVVNGEWVDGMMQPNMKDALKRMQDAYAAGLMDREIVTNKTSTCRDKFYAGQTGVFNYWSGLWWDNLQKNLANSNLEGIVTPIPAIKETQYIERPSTPFCITSTAENPEGIFENFVLLSHDGAEGEMLFTYGMEGYSYEYTDDTKEKISMLENPETGQAFTLSQYSPELCIDTKWTQPLPIDEGITNALSIFSEGAYTRDLPPTSETINENMPEVVTARNQAIAEIVTGRVTVDDGLLNYEEATKAYVEPVLEDLNK